jgi:nicotinamide-nucleotide amidase
MSDPLVRALGLDAARLVDVVELLKERGQTVATAESLTAGLVAAALTTVPGASAVVRGGLVVYATPLKTSLARVPAELIARFGAVHADVASALASGARTACGADWGIGLTGVAGPDPQNGVAPGRVYLAIAQLDAVTPYVLDLTGDRHAIRAASVVAAIDALYVALTG